VAVFDVLCFLWARPQCEGAKTEKYVLMATKRLRVHE
jgi:hypothetical protein